MGKRRVLIELHYLGCIAYYAKILQYEEIMLEACENFIKSTGRNRCCIAGANGLMRLTIPLQGGRDKKRRYMEVYADPTQRWRAIHWHSLVSAYKHAPYFEHYAPYLEPLYARKELVKLFEWNLELFLLMLRLLKTDRRVVLTETFLPTPGEDTDDARNAYYSGESFPSYHQVFIDKNGFIPNLSVLDLLMNVGNEAIDYLKCIKV